MNSMMEKRVFFCPWCRLQTEVAIEAATKKARFATEQDERSYELGVCAKCGTPVLIAMCDAGSHLNLDERYYAQQLYPPVGERIQFALPPKVDESYREIQLCVGTGAWIAAAVMVRRTLEAVAREFDASVKGLFAGLESMRRQGVISDELWNWSEHLRFLGNISAHPTEHAPPSADDVHDAVDFLHAILEIIYHYRPRFQAMKQRRAGPPSVTSAAGNGAGPS